MDESTLAGEFRHFGANKFVVYVFGHKRGMTPDEITACQESKEFFLKSLDGILAQELPKGELTDAVKQFVEHARNTDWTNKKAYMALYAEYDGVHRLAVKY